MSLMSSLSQYCVNIFEADNLIGNVLYEKVRVQRLARFASMITDLFIAKKRILLLERKKVNVMIPILYIKDMMWITLSACR